MAATAALTRLDAMHHQIASSLAMLPDVIRETAHGDESDLRGVFDYEWSESLDVLDKLREMHGEGRLPPDETARYRDTLRLIEEARPMLRLVDAEIPPA